ncbi:MAG: glutamine synthetase III, partial [Bacteroidia bacterium]
MSNLRFKAIEASITRTPATVTPPSPKISDYFGSNVFSKDTMQKFLSKEVFKEVSSAIESAQQINRKV